MGESRRIGVPKEQIHRAVDGELTKKETERLKTVVKKDPDTRAEYESLKAVTKAAEKGVKPVKPAPGFRAKVLGGLKRLRKSLE